MLMTGLRPRLNVRQRKDPPFLRILASSRFNFDQSSSILSIIYCVYHWVLEDKNETDKIYTSRLVPQKLERAPSDSCRPGSYRSVYARGL
jgi:hypothetical protein